MRRNASISWQPGHRYTHANTIFLEGVSEQEYQRLVYFVSRLTHTRPTETRTDMQATIYHAGTVERHHHVDSSCDVEEVTTSDIANRVHILHSWISRAENKYRSLSPIGYRNSFIPSGIQTEWVYRSPGFRVIDLKAEESYDEDAEAIIGGRIAAAVVVPSWTPDGMHQFISLRAPDDTTARVVLDLARSSFDRFVPLAVPVTHESLEWSPGFGAAIHSAGQLFQL